MPDSFDLSGKVALVTGGTKGIGRGIVGRLLTAGARVAFSSRTPADCALLERDLNAEFPDCAAGIAGDLDDVASLRVMVDAALQRWGRVDTLICNAAALGGHGPPINLDRAIFSRLLQVNVVHNFELIRMLLPHMVERGSGSIILITSIAAHSAMAGSVGYAAAKAAMTSMARSLAAEYADQGVRINCVSPGLIRTHASQGVWRDPGRLGQFEQDIIPMRRIGEPEEVGDACVYLASAASGYITGATIPVDGGRLGIGAPAPRPAARA